jgi:glyoxylase-like metal-dependent hydrolase (beta-lactamase superfamily II)
MSLPEYEVYAIRYASVERSIRENFLVLEGEDRPAHMDYFVWAIRGDRRVVVVDTGFARPAADRRRRQLLLSPADGLAEIGIDAAKVEDVIITHLHYDHAGNLGLFPSARFHVQESEMAYATGRFMSHAMMRHPFDLDDIQKMVERVYAGRTRFYAGDAAFAEGISLHHVGGHTQGLQVVRVHTKRGWIVLASDASHFLGNLERRNPFPVFADLGRMFEGYDRVVSLADSMDHIIAGHDPEVLTRFPRVPDTRAAIVRVDLSPAPRPAGG